ncbi:MAG TPA: hypothetical protein VMV95_01995 [Bacillota bacterium]|nr:hypothetical protein [Bacillota bacterium]
MPEETTFDKLKKGLLELLRGYPSYRFFGKIEYYLQETYSSLEVLKEDGIIEFASKKEAKELNKKLTSEQKEKLKVEGKKEPIWYRLAPKGIDLAMSLINLEHSKRLSQYTQETHYFTRVLIWLTYIIATLTFGLFIFAFFQSIIPLWF